MAENGRISREIAEQRRKIASRMITGAFAAIIVSAIAVVGATIVYVYMKGGQAGLTPEQFLQAFGPSERLISSIIPLFGAWVGAVIAFYFARDNFDAAAENTRALLRQTEGTNLDAIPADEAMIGKDEIVAAVRPRDDASKVLSGVMPQFKEKGLGRIVVIDQQGRGLGVLHDAYVNDFLLTPPPEITATADAITLAQLLDHARSAEQLVRSVVFVRPDASLSRVREEMEKASRGAPRTVRDCFVTPNGKPDEPILGYLSDIDIARRAKLGG